MKLLEQILGELGADTLKAFTIIPRFGGYFRSIKSVIIIGGENLDIGSYFEDDILIKGDIREIKIEG